MAGRERRKVQQEKDRITACQWAVKTLFTSFKEKGPHWTKDRRATTPQKVGQREARQTEKDRRSR
eukprot:554035-Pelagomonas_calceolata.AAC.1